jgi:flagellar assembly protein FliH
MSSSKWEPIMPNAEISLTFIPLGGGGPNVQSGQFEALGGDQLTPSSSEKDISQGSLPAGEERAECLLREARKRAERIEREAFEKGFAQGERAGRETSERSLATTIHALMGALTELQKSKEARTKQLEIEIVRLATAVAKKILKREVKSDPKVVLDVVRSALSKVNLQDEVIVRVNPMDRDTLLEACPAIIRGLEGVRSLKIEADEAVKQGGAMLECAMGELDVRLERQLQEIERAFEKLLRERTEEIES